MSGAGHSIPGGDRGTVVTVGTFDGVHRGHWHLLSEVCRTAERLGMPSVLVTFDPHPLQILRPDHAPPLLTTPREKIEVLAESGLNYVVFLRFDRRLSNYSPERFVTEILIGRFGMRHLVIGYDHGFGRGRSGDVKMLQALGGELGFGVDVVGPVSWGSDPVSSTRIRRALLEGDVKAAAEGLGRPYSIRGYVVRGDGRGRRLGFPTANLELTDPARLVPAPGIYAVRAQYRTRSLDGVLHVGPRPTFPGAAATIELHLFDFDEDLYGAELQVRFCARLRGIERFETEQALIEAMGQDCAEAKRVLAGGGGVCGGAALASTASHT